MRPGHAELATPRVVWGVAALLQGANDALSARFGACAVEGEVSALTRPASGHVYFSLRDADGAPALLRCAMFRRAATLVDFPLTEGLRVQARGRLAIYEPRGDLQLVVESLQRAGSGALFEQFLRLKARLESEGLFDPSRKRRLEPFPRRVGVVTSLGAAALHDVCTALARRSPQVEVVVYPSLVQGAEAPEQLVAALALAAQRAEVDTVLLVRGGGSLEDLWAFNDERVVRAVAASPVPVVCGVGHETDFTLCDFAADLRAPTPTAAAELCAPPVADLAGGLADLAAAARAAARRQLEREAQRLDQVSLRLARPSAAVQRHAQRLAGLDERLRLALERRGRDARERLVALGVRRERALELDRLRQGQRLDLLASRLRLLDPQQVLERGFAWLSDAQGHAVPGVDTVRPGDRVAAHLRDGQLDLDVRAVRR
ncbi:MAG: exodeoxyribonuclease VII large subunit [Ideonella sp.]|nr:exodeoxyribonuclease VII large subunit [Ideonella sp.]